jgi:glutamate 5-kinase
MVITNGHVMSPLTALENGAKATWFLASASPRAARKQWIAGTLQPKGRVIVDAGAARALSRGRSLLPAGVTAIMGDFDRGDAVRIERADGVELGCGLTAYGSQEAIRIIGLQSGEIEAALGYRGRDEIIHRDDMALKTMGETQ